MPKLALNKPNYQEVSLIFFIFFVIFLFFPIRFVFPSPEAFKTGAYSDFTSFQLYLSDIFLVISALFAWADAGWKIMLRKGSKSLILLVFWLVLDLFLAKSLFKNLNFYFFVRFLGLLVAYETASYLVAKSEFKPILKTFLALATLESLIAIGQFQVQKSIGLHRLGELSLLPQIQGLAKIVSNGTAYIRGYGTFFHPNLLAAFLVTAILVGLYLYFDSPPKGQKAWILIGALICLLGLTVTFSRAGYLAGLLALILFFDMHVWQKRFGKSQLLVVLAIIFVGSFAFVNYRSFLLSRATVSDSASMERIFYTKIGLNILKTDWLFGTGMGESVLHMQQYSPLKLWPWQIQPVHNYFLLAAVELGIMGAAILLSIFLKHLIRIFRLAWRQKESYFSLSLSAILLSYLILMQFDHYFYTLVPTQYLLWLVLGMTAGQIEKASQ